jgi:exosome complex component RRP4
MDGSAPARREVVIPGDLLDGDGLKPGSGTFKEGGRIYSARLGIVSERDGFLSVVPLTGRYIPNPRDVVIGKVTDLGPSHWLADINSPYPAPLHATETPWEVEFGDTERYLHVGDAILVEVLSVDEAMRVQLSMADRQFGRLTGGQIVGISPAKVPRLIGREGSMIGLIRSFTGVRMFVGQNGLVWLDGDPDGVRHTAYAIRLVEERGHLPGLTDAVREYLERAYGRRATAPAEVEDDGGH